jgi:hypothetical protein
VSQQNIERYFDVNQPKRWDIINYLIEQNKYENYLEIGVNDASCIRQINAVRKDGVDPFPGSEVGGGTYPEVNFPISSDVFFSLISTRNIKYDIIFIDGLHHSDQVDRDIVNSLKHLAPHGKIVLHDCNPQSPEHQEVPRRTGLWNGDVWKSVARLRCTNDQLQINVVDVDWGVGVVSVGPQVLYTDAPLDSCLEYAYLDNHREPLMNLISIDRFFELYSV